MSNKVACLILSIFIATALSLPQPIPLQPFSRNCCAFNTCTDGDGQYWYLYVPGDVEFNCEDIIQNTNRNNFYSNTLNSAATLVHPDFSGYAWELNGCHINGNACSTGAGDPWCDDDDAPFVAGDCDDDDNGGGTNTWMKTWSDRSFPSGVEQCPYQFTVERTWSSQTVCVRPDPDARISHIQYIYVVDQIAPNLEIPADLTIECPTNYVPDYVLGQADAVDQCSTVSVSYTSTFQRSGSVPATCNVGTLRRSFRADDRCGNFATADQVITIVDTTPPIIPQLPAVTTTCTETDPVVTGSPGAVTYYECEQFIPSGPSYLDFGNPTGCSQTSNAFGCDRIAAGTTQTFLLTVPVGELITVEFNDIRLENRGRINVYDGANSLATPLITLLTPVVTATPPTPPFGNNPGPITGSTNNIFIEYLPTTNGDTVIIDGFSGFFYGRKPAPDGTVPVASVTYNDVIVPGPCEGTYTVLRSWYASDECNNQGSMTQNIFVVDNVPPGINPLFPPQADIVEQIDCLSDFVDFNYDPVDTCSQTGATITKQVSLAGASGQNFAFGIVQTFTATDGCDNTITWSYTQEIGYYPVYISGVIPPSITGATKGSPFSISVGVAEVADALNYVEGGNVPTFCTSPIVIVVDAGPALLDAVGSDPCWTQAAGGLLYCQTTTIITPYVTTIDLSLTVPADYAPNSLIISMTVAERSLVDISFVPLLGFLFGAASNSDNVVVTFA